MPCRTWSWSAGLGKKVLETWTVSSGAKRESTGPQIQSLADAAILLGPGEVEARKALEDNYRDADHLVIM